MSNVLCWRSLITEHVEELKMTPAFLRGCDRRHPSSHEQLRRFQARSMVVAMDNVLRDSMGMDKGPVAEQASPKFAYVQHLANGRAGPPDPSASCSSVRSCRRGYVKPQRIPCGTLAEPILRCIFAGKIACNSSQNFCAKFAPRGRARSRQCRSRFLQINITSTSIL